MDYRSPLGRVRGLGSAKSGTHHWWMQRVTAAALTVLTLWLVSSLVSLAGADHATVVQWLSSPFSAALMLATLIAVFYHAQLGIQVVLEDYIASEGVRLVAVALMKVIVALLAVSAVVSVLKISLGS